MVESQMALNTGHPLSTVELAGTRPWGKGVRKRGCEPVL